MYANISTIVCCISNGYGMGHPKMLISRLNYHMFSAHKHDENSLVWILFCCIFFLLSVSSTGVTHNQYLDWNAASPTQTNARLSSNPIEINSTIEFVSWVPYNLSMYTLTYRLKIFICKSMKAQTEYNWKERLRTTKNNSHTHTHKQQQQQKQHKHRENDYICSFKVRARLHMA